MNSFNFIVSSTSTCGEKSENILQLQNMYVLIIKWKNMKIS
ncbi:hypothetical protein [Spiroplasma endosymbiont of Virgichneumon dumeticola]